MSIIKNEIPILEFDTEQSAVINPTHENLDIQLPAKCVFAFLGGAFGVGVVSFFLINRPLQKLLIKP